MKLMTSESLKGRLLETLSPRRVLMTLESTSTETSATGSDRPFRSTESARKFSQPSRSSCNILTGTNGPSRQVVFLIHRHTR